MNEFDKVEQSFKRRGLPSLFSESLFIELLLGPSVEGIEEILHPLGSGRPAAQLVRNVKDVSLININDNNNLCLFLAVELGIKYQKIRSIENKGFRLVQQKLFSTLINKKDERHVEQRFALARSLLDKINNSGFIIDSNLASYSLEQHVPIIQEYLYQLDDPMERCRLIVFGEYGVTKPLYKGQQRARYDIGLYLIDNHFYAIRKINSFLGGKNFHKYDNVRIFRL